jgi:hypothetical protein
VKGCAVSYVACATVVLDDPPPPPHPTHLLPPPPSRVRSGACRRSVWCSRGHLRGMLAAAGGIFARAYSWVHAHPDHREGGLPVDVPCAVRARSAPCRCPQ